MADEALGPVVCVNRIASVTEAIDRVNRSRFGLQAGCSPATSTPPSPWPRRWVLAA